MSHRIDFLNAALEPPNHPVTKLPPVDPAVFKAAKLAAAIEEAIRAALAVKS